VTQRPSFRDIAPPLDVDDGSLAKLADQLAVPKLVRPTAEPSIAGQQPVQDAPKPIPRSSPAAKPENAPAAQKNAPASISHPSAVDSFTIEMPRYLIHAIKRDALDRDTTARYVVMLALQMAGFEIDAADMVPDARRRPAKPASS
jgi:hypothetical protein